MFKNKFNLGMIHFTMAFDSAVYYVGANGRSNFFFL
uniref:Uncharacterized protein n=1 Tax=Anguilla anguilla TaxID=7936 RepID=A0A0E9XYG7_ANGAN